MVAHAPNRSVIRDLFALRRTCSCLQADGVRSEGRRRRYSVHRISWRRPQFSRASLRPGGLVSLVVQTEAAIIYCSRSHASDREATSRLPLKMRLHIRSFPPKTTRRRPWSLRRVVRERLPEICSKRLAGSLRRQRPISFSRSAGIPLAIAPTGFGSSCRIAEPVSRPRARESQTNSPRGRAGRPPLSEETHRRHRLL